MKLGGHGTNDRSSIKQKIRNDLGTGSTRDSRKGINRFQCLNGHRNRLANEFEGVWAGHWFNLHQKGKQVFQGTRPDTRTGEHLARDSLNGTRYPRRGRAWGVGAVGMGGTGLQREKWHWQALQPFPRIK
jgi:hypothetical protein